MGELYSGKTPWYKEELLNGMALLLEMEEPRHLLHKSDRERRALQELYIFQNPTFGTVLVIDGVFQVASEFAYIYHEMLAHMPLISCRNPYRVLVIGGGDGLILTEILKHKSVQEIVMVEYDRNVVKFCKDHFPGSHEAFENGKTEVIFGDGAVYAAEYVGTPFDVVIIDSSDADDNNQKNINNSIFSDLFYGNLKTRCMHKDSLLIRQTGSYLLQPKVLPKTYLALLGMFENVRPVNVFSEPLYPPCFSFCMAWDSSEHVALAKQQIINRYIERELEPLTQHYSPDVHIASRVFPKEIAGMFLELRHRSGVEKVKKGFNP